MTQVQTNELLSQIRSISQLATEDDHVAVATYMQKLRSMGITPGDVVDRGLKYAELFVSDMYPQARQIIRLELALYLCEKAATLVGVHAEQRRQQKLEEKTK